MSDLSPSRLPAGYRGRPATAADVRAIHRLVAARERELHGRAETGAETGADAIAADLARPDLDPALDTLLVHAPAGELAAHAWVNRGRRAKIDVHPEHRGRGLGGSLLAWSEQRARELDSERLAQSVPDSDRAAVALLRARGYAPFVTEWLLEITLSAEPPVSEPPEGISVRSFRPGDEQAAHQLTEDAFDEWQKRRKPYEEWARLTVERPDFAPEASPVAFAGGQLVGAVLSMDVPGAGEGYVDRIAVRRDHRNRGIARALLQYAFREFSLRGRRTCALWTHSDTGALPLYEHLGMTVRRSSTVYGKALTTS